MKKTISKRTYEAVCRELGFRADTKFIEVGPGGAIGFTAGKPEEIAELAWCAHRAGYKLTASLRRTGRRCGAAV